MENGLLLYMMAMEDATQRNEANRVISIGKWHTGCPAPGLLTPLLDSVVGDGSNEKGPPAEGSGQSTSSSSASRFALWPEESSR